MHHLRWQALIAILGMALVGGLLFGQGRSVTVTTVPAEGGAYTEALVGAPRRLNPLLDRANPVDRDLGRLIFSGLARFDGSGRAVPDLANWFISDDELTYTFILRPNLVWHDGQPLTAEDVAFTIGLLQDPSYPGPPDLGELWRRVEVKVLNPQTVEFTLPEPFAPFLDYTTVGLLPAHMLSGVSAGALAEHEFNLRPVGSGPFRFEGWTVEGERVTGVTLTAAADNYLRRPRLTTARFEFYADAAAAFAAYRQRPDEIYGVSALNQAQVSAALSMPELGLYTSLLPEYTLIYLNLRNDEAPFFQEKRVRQALLLGLNRRAMVADLLGGQGVVANSPVLPGSWAYNHDLPQVRYDPEAAVSLLETAGWVLPEGALAGTENFVRQKGGVPLSFTLVTPEDDLHLAVARAAQATWAPLGIRAEIVSVNPAAIRSEYLEPRAYQALLVDLNFAGSPDPDPYPLWHETQAESGQNYSGFRDRVTSELLEQARITTDLAARARLYQSFQSRFADQTPALLLYYPVFSYAVDRRVHGVQVGTLNEPSDRLNTIADWYVITRRVIVDQAEAESTPSPVP